MSVTSALASPLASHSTELLSMQITVVLSLLLPLDERGAHGRSVTLRDRERPSFCHSKIKADNTDKP